MGSALIGRIRGIATIQDAASINSVTSNVSSARVTMGEDQTFPVDCLLHGIIIVAIQLKHSGTR